MTNQNAPFQISTNQNKPQNLHIFYVSKRHTYYSDEQQPAADGPATLAKHVRQRTRKRKRHSPSPERDFNSSDSDSIFTDSYSPAQETERRTHKKAKSQIPSTLGTTAFFFLKCILGNLEENTEFNLVDWIFV